MKIICCNITVFNVGGYTELIYYSDVKKIKDTKIYSDYYYIYSAKLKNFDNDYINLNHINEIFKDDKDIYKTYSIRFIDSKENYNLIGKLRKHILKGESYEN